MESRLNQMALGDEEEEVKTVTLRSKGKGKTGLVLIYAQAKAETGAGPIGKKLGLKDLRAAKDELLVEILAVKDKEGLDPMTLSSENKETVHVVLDQKLLGQGSHKVGTRTIDFKVLQGHLEEQGVPCTVMDLVSETLHGAHDTASSSVPKVVERKQEPAPVGAKGNKADPAAKQEGTNQLAIGATKQGDFSEWYQQVLVKGDMLEYYDISGCYILKPWSYSVWESIQAWFDAEIKALGVDNAYFPMFVSNKVLEREKDHIEGFAPEVAWVTRAGSTNLEEPIAIRPTSETIMYPYYSKWIRSHRDLPLRLNQWNSVVRWEFKHPQPFLRTREYLWQEGHTAHLTKEGAAEEVLQILDLYRRVYEELLAVPMIPGVKTEKEKFAGGYYTTTIEGFIPTVGRGIQAATSHCLGQNFSKMFDITVEDPHSAKHEGQEAKKLHVWQNSWGLSTRTIGVCVMIHGDDKGLVMPPRVAKLQVVIIPCGITAKTSDESRAEINNKCKETAAFLIKTAKIRAFADLREGYTPGYKFNDWELKGVPVRLEIGPKDMEAKQVMAIRRDTFTRTAIALDSLVKELSLLLERQQEDMFQAAKKMRDDRVAVVMEWAHFTPALDEKKMVLIPFCDTEKCEDWIKEQSGRRQVLKDARPILTNTFSPDESVPQDEKAPSMGAKSLCKPFDESSLAPEFQNLAMLSRLGAKPLTSESRCAACGHPAKAWCLFGRSY